jgi:hypothetical protein
MADVGFRVTVGGEGVLFAVVESVAIGGDGGHEDVALEGVGGAGFGGGDDLVGSGAALPIVGIIEDDLEAAGGEDVADGLGVVTVGDEVFDAAAEVVAGFTVEVGDLVTGFEKGFDEGTPDEEGAPDDKNAHAGSG